MATWNEQTTRYGRPASANRFRDFLVMATFSLAALVAAFAVVQYLHANRTEPASSTAPAETAAPVAPQPESARASMQALALAMDAQAQPRSELRADLERVRGELEAAIARISELEDAVRELQAAPAPDPQPESDARPISRADPSAGSGAAPAAQPTRDDGNAASKNEAARVQAEDVAPSQGETMRYSVRPGDTAAKIAKGHCLSLADLLRLNPDVRDPNALSIARVLSVEDRCVTDSKDRAAAD